MSQYALRLPDSLMEAARKVAKRDSTSLNQLFLTAIAEKLSAIDTEEFIHERAMRADPEAYREVLRKVRDVPPQKGDELPSHSLARGHRRKSAKQRPMGSFELYKDRAGKFRFRLKAGDGEIILVSESYTQRAAAESGIELVRSNAYVYERYERTKTADGGYMFKLKATNGQVVGASEVYSSAAARDSSIELVKTNAPEATIENLTA